MHAVGVEAVPAGALGAAAVALAVELLVIVEDVVLARDVVHVEARLRDDAIGVVELGRLGEMRDVAGMNDEGRLHRQRVDLVDRFLERADGIRIGGLVEADMAVADLQECQPARLGAAVASPMMPTERGTPPATVHSTPVPAQVMHSRILRRLTPSSRCEVIPISFAALLACVGKTREARDLFPHGWCSAFA